MRPNWYADFLTRFNAEKARNATREMYSRHARTVALGAASDAVLECLRAKEAANTCSKGYREACFDITGRIMDMLRAERAEGDLQQDMAAAGLSIARADAMAGIPSSLVGAGPERAVNLEGAYALLGGQHHVDDAERTCRESRSCSRKEPGWRVSR